MSRTTGGQIVEMPENPQKAQARKWVEKGSALSDAGQHEEAVSAFNRALDLDPYLAEVFNSKGISLTKLSRVVEAIGCFDRALDLNPSYSEALNNRGSTLSGIDLHQEALENFDRALALTPQAVEPWNGKGVALDGLGKFHEAVACYDRALQANPKYAHAWFNKAESLYKAAQYPEAIAAYREFIAIAPPQLATYVDRARVTAHYAKTQMGKGVLGLAYRLLGKRGQARLHRGIKKLRAKLALDTSILAWTCRASTQIADSGHPYTPQTIQPVIEGIVARMPVEAKRADASDKWRSPFPPGTFAGVYEEAMSFYFLLLYLTDGAMGAAKMQIHRNYWSIEILFPGLAEALFKTAGEAPFAQPSLVTAITTQRSVVEELNQARRQGKEALAEALAGLQARQLPKAS